MRRGLCWAVLAWVLVIPAGCGPRHRPPIYEDEHGFRFTPPPGWSERARPSGAPGTGPIARRGGLELPMPPPGPGERLLVRYDRSSAGRSAWVWVSAGKLPASTSLDSLVAGRAPRSDWRREGNVESLTVGGQPAVRLAFAGRWGNQDYLCETVAVRRGEQVYFITASFPARDDTAREQVRRAVAGASVR